MLYDTSGKPCYGDMIIAKLIKLLERHKFCFKRNDETNNKVSRVFHRQTTSKNPGVDAYVEQTSQTKNNRTTEIITITFRKAKKYVGCVIIKVSYSDVGFLSAKSVIDDRTSVSILETIFSKTRGTLLGTGYFGNNDIY